MKQRLAILGSTGSIGVQTLDIARENPGRFEVRVLTANRNWERLARQAREFDADAAVIADKQHYAQLRDALAGTDTKVYAGEEAVAQVAAGGGTDVVVNALVGYAGLAPTVAAIEAGKKLALANKESLVVGGACVMPLARERKAPVIPIDSEHSAIFQCLVGERAPVRRLIVTCSGGAFRDFRAEELANVTVEQLIVSLLLESKDWKAFPSTSPPKKKLLWLLPGLFYLSVGRSRFVWDGSPRGLFDVKDEPFEVFAFRMVDVDRVVGRLCELVQNTDVATGNGRCGEYGHAELFPIDGL